MFIGSVKLRNSINGQVMREVVFHKGANLIVDAYESDRHNKVGKTTFLKLIDVLLGANGKDRLYKTAYTRTTRRIASTKSCATSSRRSVLWAK